VVGPREHGNEILVTYKEENFLTSRETVSFSRRIVFPFS
jgi:hypothetical protein